MDLQYVKGTNPKTGAEEIRKLIPEESFAGLAFKIQNDPHVGKLTYFRVYSGKLLSGSYVYNVNKDTKERVGRLLLMHANNREEIKEAYAGEIVAIVGLKETTTGDTLCDDSNLIMLEQITFPEPVISLAIEPKTKSDQEKLGYSLKRLQEEDPTFTVKTNHETGQTIISGIGELQLEIMVDRMKREFKVEANVGAPQVAYFKTSDNVCLRLIRYQGGTKGPVILAHGLGVSSLIFAMDTIETNMLEYLYAHGYDVWLLDYRNSIELPAATLQASGDDVATRDYPAAVSKVLELTGAKSVQMVVHCWGSTTFFMAMLAGLKGVRSAVASQIATEIRAPLATHIKTGLHLPSFLNALGIKTLTAYVDNHEGLLAKIYDDGLRLYPIELKNRCTSSTCHRITFLYAPLYEHANLNEATHDALHEMFGVANMKAFMHLARLTNTGHLVDFDGNNVYLPHLDRLAIPISFIHGAQNECFLPESTALTMDELAKANGSNLYQRHVIPGYGHIDCIYGKNAAKDVYPFVLEHLEATQ